jgi:hypothetical protein
MTPEMDKELQESLVIAGLTITGDPESIRRWRYYVLVGCFVQAWATLEYIFDLCLRIIFENAPEGRTLAKKIPTALAEKIRLFKAAHGKIQALNANHEIARSIANIMETMGRFRHLVLHSTQGFTDDQNIRNLRRMVSRDSKNVEERVNITSQQLAELIVGLFNPMMEYAKFLLTTFPTANKQS